MSVLGRQRRHITSPQCGYANISLRRLSCMRWGLRPPFSSAAARAPGPAHRPQRRKRGLSLWAAALAADASAGCGSGFHPGGQQQIQKTARRQIALLSADNPLITDGALPKEIFALY